MIPKDVLVIIPAYNEGARIVSVIEDLKREEFNTILVVDDGSKDNTGNLARGLGCIVLTHLINMGYGAGLRTGFDFALSYGFNTVITFDADGQMLAKDAIRLYKKSEEGFDYVYGSRNFNVKCVPLLRKIVVFFADVLTAFLSGKYIEDTQSGLRCIKTKLLRRFKLQSRGFSIPSELVVEAVRNGVIPKSIIINAVYTADSLEKGQKNLDCFRVVKELLS